VIRVFRALGVGLVGLATVAIAGALGQLWATRLDAERFPPPGVLVDVGGRRLHLRCEGTGQPTVILEASGFGNSHSYDAVLPRLAERTRVCAYDRAGMGWSDPEITPLGFEALEADLALLLRNAHEPPKYLFVAGSAGGLIAQLVASHHPEQVVGLVLLDSIGIESIARAPSTFDGLARSACLGSWAARFGIVRLADVFGLRKLSGDAARLSAALSYKTAPWDAACAMTRDFLPEAARLRNDLRLPGRLPLRVLSHEQPRGLLPPGGEAEAAQLEPLWQEAQANLARLSEKGSYSVVPGSGHLIVQDRPDAVVAAVLEMLDGISGQ
jgi:pimeloyl-ACP methyl ester carboxylesterase